jgi:hypothetical protein
MASSTFRREKGSPLSVSLSPALEQGVQVANGND